MLLDNINKYLQLSYDKESKKAMAEEIDTYFSDKENFTEEQL